MGPTTQRARQRSSGSLAFRAALSAVILIPFALPRVKADIDFTRDIRSILSERCFLCHGPYEAARASGLRLDEYAGAVEEREGKSTIVPGVRAESELIARIKLDDPAHRMPLGGDRLAEGQIELLEEWDSAWAKYERHCATRRHAEVAMT